MKLAFTTVMAWTVLSLCSSSAATNYVWLESPAPSPPYASWHNAAHTIQDAVDSAMTNDTVLVTNGVYSVGTRVATGKSQTNRVVVEKPLHLKSFNGPGVTTILGGKDVRCLYMVSGAKLDGFTATGAILSDSGGGLYCASTGAQVTNCVIVENSAQNAGGAYSGTFYNCLIASNNAMSTAGGVLSAVLINCIVTSNSADQLKH